jgi:hypothetical protein
MYTFHVARISVLLVEGELDGGVDGGFDAGPPPTPDEIARDLCLAMREGLVNATLQVAQSIPPERCSPTDPIADIAQLGAVLEPGACTQVDELFRSLQAGLRDGRFDVDTDQLAACAAAGREIRETLSTQAEYDERQAALAALPADAACQDIVTPLLGPDDPCGHSLECPVGTRCEADPLDSPVLRCLGPALEGQRCEEVSPDFEHLPIRTCDEGLACVLNLCTRKLGEGLDCSGQVPCEDDLECADDQVCRTPEPEQVDPLPLDGEDCDGPCAARCSVCVPDADVDGGILRVCSPPRDVGARCEGDAHCRAGLRCNAGACAALLGLGQPCAPGACLDDLACVTENADGGPSSTCQARAAIGEPCADRPCADGFCEGDVCREGVATDPCSSNGACASGNLCVANVCVAAPRDGAPCTTDGRCDTDLTCIDDRCRARPAADETCFPDPSAPPDAGPDVGICDDRSFCVAGTCVSKGDPGAACTSSDQCLSGRCLDTLTCAAEGASCVSARETFAFLLGLSFLLAVPLRRRARVRPRG